MTATTTSVTVKARPTNRTVALFAQLFDPVPMARDYRGSRYLRAPAAVMASAGSTDRQTAYIRQMAEPGESFR